MKNRKFGIKIEITGITRNLTADSLAYTLGTTTFHSGGAYNEYRVQDSQYRTWKIVSDSSIKAQRKDGLNTVNQAKYHGAGRINLPPFLRPP